MKPLITVREHARLTTADVPASETLARVSQTAFDWLLAESSRLQGPGSGARLVELETRRELRRHEPLDARSCGENRPRSVTTVRTYRGGVTSKAG